MSGHTLSLSIPPQCGSPKLKKHTGLVGDLSPPQHKALEEFRALVTPEEKRNAGPQHSDDHALLRFLRARNFIVPRAHALYRSYGIWRIEKKIDNLLNTTPAKQSLLRRLVPHAHHGVDREGRPVLYEKSGRCPIDVLLALVTPQEYLANHTWDQEFLLRRCEESSKRLGINVETFTMILDLSGVDMQCRKGSALLALCSESDKQNFPERLGRLVIINPPQLFPIMYKIASPFIDQRTKRKIIVAYGDPKETLLKLIAPDQVPFEYGGECKCPRVPGQLEHVWGCVPEYDISQFSAVQEELLKQSVMLAPPPSPPIAAPPRHRGSQERSKPSSTSIDIAPQLKERTIGAGQQFSVIFSIYSDHGGSIVWAWRVLHHDIKFWVEVYPTKNESSADKNTKFAQEPIRCEQHQGCFTTESTQALTVRLVWDNSFSFFNSKTIQYSTSIVDKDEANFKYRELPVDAEYRERKE